MCDKRDYHVGGAPTQFGVLPHAFVASRRGAGMTVEEFAAHTERIASFIRTGEPVEDNDGVIVGAINCFHETTTLHHEADDFEDFFENSAVALALVSGNGTILRANRAELEMLGYRAEEYVGRNITDFHVDRTTID